MLSDCWYCSLSEKSLSSCYCWHRCCLLTAQVLVLVLVLVVVVLALVVVVVVVLALVLAPQLWR
jgi:hypothetical protein